LIYFNFDFFLACHVAWNDRVTWHSISFVFYFNGKLTEGPIFL